MIEDEELRSLFAAESEEHLKRLEQGFLRLEEAPADEATLEEVLREAHSLKGSARMLGLSDIELLSHRLEDALRSATRGEVQLAPESMERLYAGLDALRAMCNEAIGRGKSGVDVAAVMRLLNSDEVAPRKQREKAPRPETVGEAQTVSPPGRKPARGKKPKKEPAVRTSDNIAAPPQQAKTRDETEAHAKTEVAGEAAAMARTTEYRIDTIRVAPRSLDALMTHAGELIVIRTRIAQRLSDAENLATQCEELERLLGAARQALRDLQMGKDKGTIKTLSGRLDAGQLQLKALGRDLQQMRNGLYDDSSRLDNVAGSLDEGIREVRMLPLTTVFDLFPRMVRDISKDQHKEVQLIIEGGDTRADKRVLEEVKDPLMHLIRNAIHHGIEMPSQREAVGKPPGGVIRLSGRLTAAHIVIEVVDDGHGLDLEKIREVALKKKLFTEAEMNAMTEQQLQSMIFMSGFSTQSMITDISGRGVGMDVVRNNIEGLKGRIEVESQPGRGCSMRCTLPLTLATARIILARVADHLYGIPVEFVQASIRLARESLFTIEGRATVNIEGEPLSLASLGELLELPGLDTGESDKLTCIILFSGQEKLGVLVDAVEDEQEIVLKPVGALLKRVRNVTGSGILGTGEVCMVLNPQDLIRSVRSGRLVATRARVTSEKRRRPVVLLAEDSLVTRTQEKRIFEGAGYEVVVAVDGAEAWARLGEQAVDALVSDVMMPNMNGFELTTRIRSEKRFEDLPVILVTTLSSDEHRRKGMEAGANAYISKSAFDQTLLLETLERLAGSGVEGD